MSSTRSTTLTKLNPSHVRPQAVHLEMVARVATAASMAPGGTQGILEGS